MRSSAFVLSVFAILGITISFNICGCSSADVSTRQSPSRSTTPTQYITPQAFTDTSRIAVGDSISFSVWQYPEFTARGVVKATGTIGVPLVGEILALGYSAEEFTQQLKRRLGEFIKGDIKLNVVVTIALPKITVLGAVSRQGSFPTSLDVALLEVLSAAGGWSPDSDTRFVRITRGNPISSEASSFEVDVDDHLSRGDIRSLPSIRPGDVVYVPKKENYVRELSEFFRDALLLIGLFGLLN